MDAEQVRGIYEQHAAYWDALRPELRELKALYMTRYWRDESGKGLPDQVRVELSKGYKTVESYIGSLYARNPSVQVEPDIRRRGNPEVAEATSNRFLLTTREVIEDATRLAFIFPCGFIKLAPTTSPDPLKRVVSGACPPWEVIVDPTATSWDGQRYVGHTYLMPLDEARTRYGGKRRLAADLFSPQTYTSWIDAPQSRGSSSYTPSASRKDDDSRAATDAGKWVRVVEVYDLVADELLVWSPDYRDGERFLFSGVKVQIGALDPDAGADTDTDELEQQTEHVKSGIPYKTASGRPVVPIVPLYFSRDPEIPLRGYSLLHRIRDQLKEANVFRTYQARGVRRMARQWLVRAGFLGETQQAKVSAGIDGEFIEVDLNPGESLEGNMLPVPNAPIPADVGIYTQQVLSDIDEASVLAPFTRGEATNTTATEQRLLASYTSSEIGRMARIRDAAITELARTYNVMLSVMLGDDAEPLSLPGLETAMLSASDLTGDFQYWATEGGSTPMSDMAKQDALTAAAPLLLQLGVPPEALREEMVRAFNFPESFNPPPAPPEAVAEEAVAEEAVAEPLPAPGPPGMMGAPLPGTPPDGAI